MAESTYQVKIAEFEGPFDLILFFIERDELDIYDIPIARLTNDFLEYIKAMKEMNVDLASEFILVAATLMRIKAKTLLPRKEVDEKGEEIDPREELVRRLLEYKRYKGVVDKMRNLAEVRENMHCRGDIRQEVEKIYDSFGSEMELESIDLFKIMKIFNKVLDRMEDRNNRTTHRIIRYPYTMDEQRSYLRDMVSGSGDVPFLNVFDTCRSKIEAIFRFLAMLELVQQKIIDINMGMGVNNLWINAKSRSELG